ncbi:uncharacterized protein G2W53_020995 [Senna tora]|uniref:Endonuclease/exonuclease/phosphatase domain-containing protein n=1 Tax=Senna tora TaxID=362788 RepID=A0A834TL61_9FABA|nr:uncharacterized protein G2W53_020995 [Senna tora]
MEVKIATDSGMTTAEGINKFLTTPEGINKLLTGTEQNQEHPSKKGTSERWSDIVEREEGRKEKQGIEGDRLGGSLLRTGKRTVQKEKKLRSEPTLINIGSGFFIIRFGNTEDRWSALLHGPTIINGHLLAIDFWKQGFNSSVTKSFSSSPVWIKLESLPIELFAPNILIRIGNSIGKFIGIDGNTHNMCIAKHARICVLMDLSGKVPSNISIGNYNQAIIIEGISNICLTCGGANHAQNACKGKRALLPLPPTPSTKEDDGQTVSRRKSGKIPSVTANRGRREPPSNSNLNKARASDNQKKEQLPTPRGCLGKRTITSEKVQKGENTSLPKGSRDGEIASGINQIPTSQIHCQYLSTVKENKVDEVRERKIEDQESEPRGNRLTSNNVQSSEATKFPKSKQKPPSPKSKRQITASKLVEAEISLSQEPMPPVILSPKRDTTTSKNTFSPPNPSASESSKGKSADILNQIPNRTSSPTKMPRQPRSSHANRSEVMQRNRNQKLKMELRKRLRFAKYIKTPVIVPLRGFFMTPQRDPPLNLTNLQHRNIRVPYHWRIWENLTTTLTSQTTWFQAWAWLMLESQLVQIREHAVKELMKHLRDNGQAMLFPPAIIQTSPAPIDPPMNNELFNSNQLLQVFNMDLFTVLTTIQGNQPQGVLLYTSNSVQIVDAIVTSSLLPETGYLEYHLKFSPTPSLRYTGKFYMDDSPHSEHYINPEIEESVGSVGHDEVEIDNNMIPINILVWNARGAASADFRRVVMDLKTRHLPRVMFITETRVGGTRAENIIRSIGYDGFFKVDPMGYAGGLWLMWDPAFVKLDIHGESFQEIQASIEVSNTRFLTSFVYASPIRERRRFLWDNLMSLADIHSLPWLVCGDFNEVLSQDEKVGGSPGFYV